MCPKLYDRILKHGLNCKKFLLQNKVAWEFPDGQWLGLGAFTAMVPGSIPGQGTKILQAAWCSQK